MLNPDASQDDVNVRKGWIAALAHADPAVLSAAWEAITDPPAWRFLRPPQTGLAMVRGRIGGDGQPFNFGEVTMTRAAVVLADGTVGHGHVTGRAPRHAELVALFDALLQDPARRPGLMASLIDPLVAARAEGRRRRQEAVAATKVDFFTLVRGE